MPTFDAPYSPPSEFESRGGARIGGREAGRPLATLRPTATASSIDTPIVSIASSPLEVVEIRAHRGPGPPGRESTIVQTRDRRTVDFSCGDPDAVRRGIREVGFVARGRPGGPDPGRAAGHEAAGRRDRERL